MLKNALVYTLAEPVDITADALEEKLQEHEAQDIRRDQGRALGWTAPAGRGMNQLLHELEGQRLMALMNQERVLPADVVNEEVEERAQALAERQGHPLTKKEKAAIKEEVTLELLKVSHVRKKVTLIWWDVRRSRIVIGATNRKKAEEALDFLRETLGSLKVLPLATKTPPVQAMTNWLNDPGSRPAWLELGEEAILKDSSDDSTYTAKKADLDSDEAARLLSSGRTVTRLGIKAEGYLNAVLMDDLAIKSIRYDDAVREQADQENDDDNPVTRLETDFIILVNALAAVISDLIDALDGLAKAPTVEEKVVAAGAA